MQKKIRELSLTELKSATGGVVMQYALVAAVKLPAVKISSPTFP